MRTQSLLPAALVTAFLSGSVAAPARASDIEAGGFLNGNTLLQECQSSAVAARAQCRGFVMGVADAMSIAQVFNEPVAGRRACPRDYVTWQQPGDVATSYLTRHPELRHYIASWLVANALEEAFPCTGADKR